MKNIFALVLISSILFAPNVFANKSDIKEKKEESNKVIKLSVGLKAPNFSAKTQDGKNVKLSDFKGKNSVLLVFYPGDNTPVCTKQLCDIRDDYKGLEKKGIKVFGINQADEKSHKDFIKDQKLPFSLIIDEKLEISKNYDAMGAFGFINRTVVLINKEGKIVLYERGTPDVSAKKIKNLI